MALWVCEGCGTLYAVGLFRCPRCHETAFHEFGSKPEDEEHPMAKITVHGGPTDATAEAVEHPADGTLSPEIEGDGTGEALPAATGSSRPKASDVKGEWETWAVAAGYDEDYVAAQTKGALQDLPDDPAADADYQAWLDAATEPDLEDEPVGDDEPAGDAA